jgi:drug/metabolite transporter (DMT)-like permease
MTEFRTGMILMVCGALLIPFGDALAKYANQTYGLPMGFMAWSRFAIGALILAPIAIAQGVRFRDLTPAPVLFRGLLITCTIFFILKGAALTDLASAYGAFFLAPIISFVLAVVLLKERAGLMRWLMMALGFIGVLLVAQPGATMSAGIAFALLAGVFYGSFLTTNRYLAGRFNPYAMLMAQLIVGGIILIPFAASGPQSSFSLGAWICIGLSAASSVLANLLMVLAYMRAEATRLAPLIYTQLIAATLYGILFFNSLPDLITIAGLSLLLLSGAAGLIFRLR